MKKILLGLTAAVLIFSARPALAGHIEQPNFPRKPNPSTELVLTMDDFDCGAVYILQYEAGAGKFWKFYYLGDNFSHKPIIVVFSNENESEDVIKVWTDRDRDGHFDELFPDGADVAKKYPTPCTLIGVNS